MRQQLSAYLDQAITGVLLLVVGLTPIIFASFTTEYYEMPKLIFLVEALLVLILLWSLSWLINGRVSLTRTPLDLPLLMLLVVVLLSAFFSQSRFISIFGNFPRVHGSVVSWIAYILFFFVAVSHLKSLRHVKLMLYVLLTSTVIVSILSLVSFFGFYLPFDFIKGANFTPTGSTFSTLAMVLLLLPITLTSIISPNRYLPQIPALVLTAIFGVVIAFLGNPTIYLVSLITLGLSLFVSKRHELQRSLPYLVLPLIISLLAFTVAVLPIKGIANPVQQKYVNFPREIQLALIPSWKVASSVLRDTPFLGTGPATFLFNYTTFKPAEQNNTKFWNLAFDSAYNEPLQVFSTLGLLGLLSIVFLIAVILNFSFKNLSAHNIPSENGNEFNKQISIALAISGLVAVILLLVHSTTLVSITISLTILALLMATQKSIRGKVQELTIGIKASSFGGNNAVVTGDALPLILFIPIIIFIIYVFWNMIPVVLADHNHRLALNAATKQSVNYNCGDDKIKNPSAAIVTYNCLVKAEQLNPYIDLYRVDLAQTNFALANSIAAQKGPTEASPGGSLTDEDKRTIQQLLSQAINEGRAAVAVAPHSARNWEILASIYRQISGVAQNALAFSLDAYGRAIQKDPSNPMLRLNVGGIYYSVKNYDLAIRFFTDAIYLKPDYANAFYNLSVALRDKGDLRGAQAAAERVVSLLEPKSSDYQTASNYLADLKARIATGSASENQITPPAAQPSSVLQNEQLPDVNVDLKQRENVATPAAVKRNPRAKLDLSTPTPEETPEP